MRVGRFAAFLVLAALGTVSAVPISGSLTFDLLADPTGTPSAATWVLDSDTDSWSGTPASLSVSAVANIPNYVLSGSASATWAADGNSGTVSITAGVDHTRTNIQDFGTFYINNSSPVPPAWVYEFIADEDGFFELTYTVSGAGSPRPTLGFFDGSASIGFNTAGDSGMFSFAVTKGASYKAALYSGLSTQGNVGDGSSTGAFSWTLPVARTGPPSPNTVPDAGASLLLFGLSLAALAGFHRSRKR